VKATCPKLPGVYEFVDPLGTVVYVGKAKSLRTRLLSYFTAPWPESKSARLIRCADQVRWRAMPSEFAALLEELRLIQALRPTHNVVGSRYRASLAFIKVAGSSAPKLTVTESTRDSGALYYGPFRGRGPTSKAVRTLSDLLMLRDCADRVKMVFADQPSLFDAPLAPACIRHDLGTCLGPCAARVSADRYAEAARAAADFLEGRSARPLDRVLDVMAAASEQQQYERAALWRGRFEEVTWLFTAVARLRAAIDGLSFVYEVADESGNGDDRVYLVRHGVVAGEAAHPRTPLERAAFAATVRARTAETVAPAARSGREMGQLLLVMSWFRQHPDEYEHTSPFAEWTDAHA
jgi:excinuclease ABC subunit C